MVRCFYIFHLATVTFVSCSRVPMSAEHKQIFAPHEFTLDMASRKLGMPYFENNSTFLQKLERGEPVTVVILGASVAENSGCFDQADKRCMANNGRQPVTLVWGEPRKRPFKGFMVRWFEWMNATWPHAEHRLYNAGRDASSLSTIMPCLFSNVPPQIDLFLIEAGSIFGQSTTILEILLRKVLSMRHPPTVAFVTVHLWCTYGGSLSKKVYSHGKANMPRRHYKYWVTPRNISNTTLDRTVMTPWSSKNPSDVTEDFLNLMCKTYGVSCISQRDALTPNFKEAKPGFGIEEIAGDCLHPVHGSLGTEYITDLLVQWTMRAAHSHRSHSSRTASYPPDAQSAVRELPQALHRAEVEAHANEKTACYRLGQGMGRSRDAADLPWHTGKCDAAATKVLSSKAMAGCENADVAMPCPSKYTLPGHAEASRMPTVWTFCTHAIGDNRKISPAVVAFHPGATIFVPVPTEWMTQDSNAAESLSFNITMLYLISWNSMGSARIGCTDECTCADRVIDAHQTFAERNVTVFTDLTFGVRMRLRGASPSPSGSDAKCGVSIVVLDETSSGGHMFKLRDMTVHLQKSPCDIHRNDTAMLRFMRVRNGLRCAGGSPH